MDAASSAGLPSAGTPPHTPTKPSQRIGGESYVHVSTPIKSPSTAGPGLSTPDGGGGGGGGGSAKRRPTPMVRENLATAEATAAAAHLAAQQAVAASGIGANMSASRRGRGLRRTRQAVVRRLSKPLVQMDTLHPVTKVKDGVRAPRRVVSGVRRKMLDAIELTIIHTTQAKVCYQLRRTSSHLQCNLPTPTPLPPHPCRLVGRDVYAGGSRNNPSLDPLRG